MDLANYSTKIGHVSYAKLCKLIIKLPNDNLLSELCIKNKIIENKIIEISLKYNQYIKELSEKANV